MKPIACAIALLLIAATAVPGAADRPADANKAGDAAKVRFAPLAIFVDPQGRSLAAYQFELKAAAGQVQIVRVEGGEHTAFKAPPYYDPAALAQDRIIIGAFSTDQDLPTARTRVATVHVQVQGDVEPQYELALTVAADGNGREIRAVASFDKE